MFAYIPWDGHRSMLQVFYRLTIGFGFAEFPALQKCPKVFCSVGKIQKRYFLEFKYFGFLRKNFHYFYAGAHSSNQINDVLNQIQIKLFVLIVGIYGN